MTNVILVTSSVYCTKLDTLVGQKSFFLKTEKSETKEQLGCRIAKTLIHQHGFLSRMHTTSLSDGSVYKLLHVEMQHSLGRLVEGLSAHVDNALSKENFYLCGSEIKCQAVAMY